MRVRGLVAHRGRAPNPEEWSRYSGNESHLLGAFDTFRTSRTVAAGLLPRLLKLGAPQPEAPTIPADTVRTPLRRLCARVAFALGMFLTGVAITKSSPDTSLVLQIFGFFACVIVFSDEIGKWRSGYAVFKAHYDEQFEEAPQFALLDANRALSSEDAERLTRELASVGLVARPQNPLAAALNDVIVRKVTADIVAAGFVHDADAAGVPHAHATTVYRIFRAPDGCSYLAVCFYFGGHTEQGRIHSWPAVTSMVHCQTFFADGTRLETCTQSDPLTTLGRSVPTTTWHTVPPDTPPLECYARHQKLLAERTTESESPALKHVSPERYVAIQNEISTEQYEAYWRRPFGPRDHFPWYVGRDRPT